MSKTMGTGRPFLPHPVNETRIVTTNISAKGTNKTEPTENFTFMF